MYNKSHSPTYLIKNPYSYCFRIKVPKDLQATLSRKELRYSLKTGNLSEAKTKARLLAGVIQLLYGWLRKGASNRMDLSDTKIQSLIKQFLQSLIKKYDQPAEYIKYTDEWTSVPFKDQDGLEETLDFLDEIKEDLNLKLQTGNYGIAERKADRLLAENDLDYGIDKSSLSYRKLCTGIIRAMIKGVEYNQKRLSGSFSDEIEDVLEGCLPGTNHQMDVDDNGRNIMIPCLDFEQIESSSDVKNRKDSPALKKYHRKKLSEVIPLFVDETKARWNAKTKSEVIASLELFVEVVGDDYIQSINRAKVAEYKSILKKLPPNKNKKKEYRNKSIAELIEMPIEKTLSVERVNKNLQRAGALFDYAIRHGIYEGPNPATKMQMPKNKWAKEKRAPFTYEELDRLLRSEMYVQDSFSKSYMFWTPIIALFHGMRQNEIAGLFIKDIKVSEDGIWFFDLFSKKSKPDSAYRVAPIHQFLIEELNFLIYVQNMKAHGHDQLFPECKKGRDGYGKAVSSWFNDRYKGKCGITSTDGRMRDFHSFRTTFITHLRHKKVHDRMLKEVVGHSVNIDVTDIYTDPYPIKQLLDEVVAKASFHKELDLSHLKKSKFVPR